jgi:glutathione S-transferase
MMRESSDSQLCIIGRSSSHFTRVTRLFAAEVGVSCGFEVVRDLLAVNAAHYGGNPSLKVPALRTPHGVWFGALNVCRELERRSTLSRRIVWPEHLTTPLTANAQELIFQAMGTEVALIMAKLGSASRDDQNQAKMRQSLLGTLTWLDGNVDQVLAALPAERELSLLEIALFCLVTHLKFRDVLPVVAYPALTQFCETFALRESAGATSYYFDA